MTLTIEKLSKLYREYKRPKPIYYIVDKFFPNLSCLWRIPMYGEDVWIVHPDSFAAFERICVAEYVEIKRFEVTDEMILAEIEKLQQQINEGLVANFKSTLVLTEMPIE